MAQDNHVKNGSRRRNSGKSTGINNNKKKLTKEETITELLKKCSNPSGDDEKELTGMFTLIQSILEFEKGEEGCSNGHLNVPMGNRGEDGSFERFIIWCQENGVDVSRVRAAIIDPDLKEFGLKANVDVSEDELLLRIPRKLILSVESDLNTDHTSFGEFLKSDPLVKSMANISLTMRLIYESCRKSSFWSPYLQILPTEYRNSPLFMSPEMICCLKPSPAFEESVKLIRNICRQFSYFWTQMRISSSPARKLPFRNQFSFSLYRWAVCTTMTRQNMIPSSVRSSEVNNSDGSRNSVNALIPLWDLCNHRNGKFSTDYNSEKDEILCYAMSSFPADSEITIFYGNRSNGEFFLHNGFVYDENPSDFLSIKLGLSKNDPLFHLKSSVCLKYNLPINGNFRLYPKSSSRKVYPPLWAFLRIFHMNQNQLEMMLNDDVQDENMNHESIFEDDSGKYYQEIDLKINNYLRVRASLLLQTYPSHIESSLNENSKKSTQLKLIRDLHRSEKMILQSYLETK